VRRIVVAFAAFALLAIAAPAGAAVRFNLGSARLNVTEWDSSQHAITTPLDGWWARPPSRFHGRRPVIVLIHGSYPSCTAPQGPDGSDLLPCDAGHRVIDNAGGFRYLVDALAKAGYVALSVDGNVAFSQDNHIRYGDGFESTSSGAFSLRALVVDQVLRRMAAASHGGTFAGRRLVGRVDLAHVGIAGHSRGGEGVIDGAAQGVFSGGPYHLSALLGIAPTNFDLVTPPDVPFGMLLGYCDGDVFNLGGLAYYDAATRDPNRVSPAYAQVLLGANHNFFDTAWTFQDEAFATPYCAHRAIGRSRLASSRQRAAAIRFARAFFRRHLSHGGLSSVLAASGTAPASLSRALVTTSFQAGRAQRRALDVPADTAVNAVGGAVRGTALGVLDLQPPDLSALPSTPWSPQRLLARTLGANGTLSEALPGTAGDARGFRALAFRAAVDPRVVPARRRRLQVSLVDTAGHRSTVTLASEAALRTPPASRGGQKAILGSVRIRLTRFKGVDRAHLARIELRAPGSGRLLLADLAFQR
jgi:hypothetical protein